MPLYSDIISEEIRMIFEEHLLIRPTKLSLCKTKEDRERLKDRWAIKDAADKIAAAIRWYPRKRSKFLGIF